MTFCGAASWRASPSRDGAGLAPSRGCAGRPPHPLLPSEEAVPAAAAIHPTWRKGRRRVSGRCRHPGHSDALAGGDVGPEMGDRRYNVDACVREGRGLLQGSSSVVVVCLVGRLEGNALGSGGGGDLDHGVLRPE
jgi:hypothetical protein